MHDPANLLAQFRLVVHYNDVRPTDAHLDAFEYRHRLRLPDDYRTFIKAFGAGTIGGLRGGIDYVYAPITVPPDEHPSVDLTLLNAQIPYGPGPSALDAFRAWIDNGDARPEVAALERRLKDHIFFCLAAEGDDQFAWSRTEVTDPATGDMAIDLIQPLHLRVHRVADTFRQFVLEYLLAGRYSREESGGLQDYYPDPDRVVEYYQYPYNIPNID